MLAVEEFMNNNKQQHTIFVFGEGHIFTQAIIIT